ERDVWGPLFRNVMTSLQITRDDQLFMRQVANELLLRLRDKHPDQDFHYDADTIRGRDRVVYLSNLLRDVRSSPDRREALISRFVETLSQPATAELGHEVWENIIGALMPILKPREYVDPEGPTKHLLTNEWLEDMLICYAIRSKNMFRFV